MSMLETNIFAIENLDALKTDYVLYRIRGLTREDNEYFQNKDEIARKLSYDLQRPALVIERNGHPYLVLPADTPPPPQPFSLVRVQVYLDKQKESLTLDYAKRNHETDDICLRFLNFFAVQGRYRNDKRLWQPRSGQPFFEYKPVKTIRGIDVFQGFSARAVITPDNGIGICLDLRTKFVASKPLDARLKRDGFRPYRGQHFIYRFKGWYGVQLQDYCDLNASEAHIDTGNCSVYKYLRRESPKPLPQQLANLPRDAALAYYQTNRGNRVYASVGLCHLIYDTRHPEVQRRQGMMTPQPHERDRKIQEYAAKYLQGLQLGRTRLEVSRTPITAPRKVFQAPDIEFGGEHVLSVRRTAGAHIATMDTLGKKKQRLLMREDAGFFVKRLLGPQYLIMPESVYKTWGKQYIKNLKQTVERLYGPAERDEVLPDVPVYDPKVITYNDCDSGHTYVEQGRAILDAAEKHRVRGGYGLIMIHDASDREVRQEDQLAAMLSQQFWEQRDMRITVNHTKTGSECYSPVNGQHGAYVVNPKKRGKLNGYLRNVALSKILLNNEMWPFVLATPLHADVTIGLDVKRNTVGLTVVSDGGRSIATLCRRSSQKEKLTRRQIETLLTELLRHTAEKQAVKEIKEIVIHRDGRSFQSEIDGAINAKKTLQAEGLLPSDVRITILDVSKTAMTQVRLFDVKRTNGRLLRVENPQNGTYVFLGNQDAYLCSTGREFGHSGTTQMLHVRYELPGLPFEQALEDLYYLTTLTWSKPDDCSRYPVTMKLTDRWLWQDATEYNQDVLVYGVEEG